MLSVKGLTFDDVHSDSLNLLIADDGTRRPLFAETKDTFVEIPFRDGAVLIADDSHKDVEVEVDFLLIPEKGQSLFDACRDIAAWLRTDKRKRLIFDDDPDWFYVAKVVSSITVEEIERRYGEFTVVFRCEPHMREVNES